MGEHNFTTREQIVEVVNKLFVYTDYRQWVQLQDEIFADEVLFDMASLSGEQPVTLNAEAICRKWAAGFSELEAVNHLAGNYIHIVKRRPR